MCLADTPNDPLARRPFNTEAILSSQDREYPVDNSLVDCGCTGAYTVINEAIVPKVCAQLQIEPLPLSVPKPLRGYDGKLSEKPITHCLLPNMSVGGHKEGTCPMLIAPLGNHDVILGKPWMNKHGVLLDMLRDKVLFVPGRCNHDGDKVSPREDLTFLTPVATPSPASSPVILKRPRPPSPTVEAEEEDPASSSDDRHEADKDSSDSDAFILGSSRGRTIPNPREIKKQKASNPDYLDIHEISADAFYMNAKDKRNKLFSLTMNEVHELKTPDKPPARPLYPKTGRNAPCPCESGSKYKRCCGSNILLNDPASTALGGSDVTPVEINATEILTSEEVKLRLPFEYHDYLDVFDRDKADELPPHRPYDHKLEFMDDSDRSKMPRSRIYPMSGHKLEQVKKYLDEHLKKGFIVPSKAPFASPVLFAEKPDGGLRFCVDYRRLNQITKRNRYPIPLIDEVLARVQGCKYLTKLDIIAAFNKLRMHPDSEDFTTFVTSLGAYKYRVLPFGLTNGPATYQHYMNDILFDYLNDFCQAYLDDILIYSKSKKEHVRHVRLVLQKLREAGLQVDILKCEFHVQETKFLGLLVSIDGLRIDPTKIQAVIDWKTPTNLKESQAFVGFCNFYRRFIRNFSKIVKALVRLTQKGVIFEWSSACQEAFQRLKKAITEAPVLRHFDRSKEAILETDSSDYINGGVLSQYDEDGLLHPVAFYSKNLTPAECNYQIYDKELLAIIKCLEHWRPELECTEIPVKIFTDHKGLMYFAEGQDLSRRQARYLDMLSEFNIKIIYRPGPQNVKADALTRMPGSKPTDPSDERLRQQHQVILTPERLELDGVSVNAIDDPLYHKVTIANKDDEDCSDIRDAIAEGKQKHNGINLTKCSVIDDVLYHKERLCVPEDLYTAVIQEVHDQPACGHPGIARTCELVRREYYWRGMNATIAQYIRNCYTCQRAKAPRDREHGLLQPLPIPQKRWQDISMDFITGLPLSDMFDAICVFVDRLTKERHYVPCTAGEEGTSSETTADMLVKEVFRLHGLPASIISDRGPQFIADLWKAFCKRLGIEAKLSTAFHPETDGQTERSNQDLERHLRTYCNYMQDDWAKWISMAEFADNDAVSSATKVTPFFANKGFNPRMSFSPDTTDYDTTRKRLAAAKAEDITGHMERVLEYIRENMGRSQQAMADQVNRHRLDVTFKKGDMVFLSSKNITSTRPSKKLDNKRYGPFQIKETVGTSYRLKLPPTIRIHDVFHPKLLSLAAADPLPGQKRVPPPAIVVDGIEEWEVEDILDSKKPWGRLKYRVNWKGYDEDLTWYNADAGEFNNAREVVEDFHKRYPDRPC